MFLLSGGAVAQPYAFPEEEADSIIVCNFSGFLELPEDSIQPMELYRLLECWRGTPYKYSGADERGIDCSGFACKIFSEVYNVEMDGGSADIFRETRVIDAQELTKGDLLFFKIRKNEISHVGVYLGNNKFIHASVKKGVIISDLDEPYYKKHFYRAGRCMED